MSKLLPSDFDIRIKGAVRRFWMNRLNSDLSAQEGGRGGVIGGKNLEGFSELIRDAALFCGMPPNSVFVEGKTELTIPGYFRPTKMWDALVFYRKRLVAAFELKSQVGPSFGNNFNNRSEESIGSATDFWTAHRERLFVAKGTQLLPVSDDAKPPFLGYLMLLEDCPKSMGSVRTDEVHFPVASEFVGSSYAQRYELLLDRLVAEKLYSSACLILSNRISGEREGEYSSPKLTLGPTNLFADFAGAMLAALETYR